MPLVGYDRAAKQYAFYNTYDTNLHWADIYYMGDPAGKKANSISMVRTVEFIPSGEPDIAVDASSLNFGTVEIGDNSVQYITVSNTGAAADLSVTQTDHSGPNAADFSILNGAPFTLAPGNARQIGIRFAPTGSGSRSATMVFDSNDPDENPLEIGLSGIGTDADPMQWVKAESPGGGIVNVFAVMGENAFAGTEYGGVFVSQDRGATWNPVNTGLPNLCIRALAADGARLFAGTWGNGAYCSTDSGANWNPAITGLTNLNVTCLEAGEDFGNVQTGLLAGTWGGVFYSSDDGQTWTEANNGITETHVRSVMIADGLFFAGTINGLFRSVDNGKTWSAAENGLTNKAVHSLAHRGIRLYAGTGGGGVFTSANGGDTWVPCGSGIEAVNANSLALGRIDLYTATWGAGVFVKPHEGEGWSNFSSGLAETNIRSIAVCPGGRMTEPDNLLAGTEGGEIWRKRIDEGFGILVDGEMDYYFSILPGPDDGLLNLRSYAWNDNGKPDSDDDLSARIWTAWDPEWFYLYEEARDDVLSGNSSNVWEEDCIELKIDPQPMDSTVNSIWDTRLTALYGQTGVVASDNMDNIAATDKQWVRRRLPGGYILELAFRWTSVQSGAETVTPTEGTEFGMAINQHDNDGGGKRTATLQWAAVLADAVYMTPKFMGTVRLMADHRLQFIPANKMTGVTNPVPYDGSDYTRTGIRETGMRPATLALGQNYPNPFNPSTTIFYSLPVSSEVRLSVIDILGREVSVPVHGIRQAGVHEVTFEAGRLASGIYFYRLEAGANVLIRKMVISR